MKHTAKLLYGCGADSYYATRMEIPDPYLWYRDSAGRRHGVYSTLEIDRARKVADVDECHAMAEIALELKKSVRKPTPANLALWLIEADKPEAVDVPADFPAAIFAALREAGVNVRPTEGYFFPEREIKTPEEVEKIRRAQHLNQLGFSEAFRVLGEAEIGKEDLLFFEGKPLTSECLRGLMNARVALEGAAPLSGGPIVAAGAQGADPHERGHGPLKASTFIIIDSFPCGPEFYYSDLTRTVLKGKASPWHQDVYEAVLAAQLTGIEAVKPGVTGREIHQQVNAVLEERGFTTGMDNQGRHYGFFHGTGHAVGLEVHDIGARISPAGDVPLAPGMVVTIEPGLYYPEKGGVRIEDIVAVTPEGHDNLTTLEKFLVID